SKQKGLSDRTLDLEVGERRGRAAFTGGQPLIDGQIAEAAALAALPGRRLVFFGFRIDARITAVEAGENQALIANVHDAFVILAALKIMLVLRCQAGGAGRAETAVIPGKAQRRTTVTGGEIQVNDGGLGKSLIAGF